MGLRSSSAHLSQVSEREAAQVLGEGTDSNCVLIPMGAKVRRQPGERDPMATAALSCSAGTTGVTGPRLKMRPVVLPLVPEEACPLTLVAHCAITPTRLERTAFFPEDT